MNNSVKFSLSFEVKTDDEIREYPFENDLNIPCVGDDVEFDIEGEMGKVVLKVKSVKHSIRKSGDETYQHTTVCGDGWGK